MIRDKEIDEHKMDEINKEMNKFHKEMTKANEQLKEHNMDI